uniref:Uncharacterized protein n=1 Tax=Anopheles arabiensis TaxID=7173 RepID=A0A2C9GPB1_ANOAR
MKQLYLLALIVLIVATCLMYETASAPSQIVKREAMYQVEQCTDGTIECPMPHWDEGKNDFVEPLP